MTVTPTDVAANVADVRDRVAAAARRAGRDPHTVTLVAVTKTVPAALVAAAFDAGLVDLGENRAQDLAARVDELGERAVRWHFVGRLQTNKVRVVGPIATRIHSVDRASLAEPLRRHALDASLLVQVNVAREPQKGGCDPDACGALLDALTASDLGVDGLMTVPPLGSDPRPVFDALARLADRFGLRELSMGMSDDFEVAIAHGATIVRVGRALFGPRPGAPAVQG